MEWEYFVWEGADLSTAVLQHLGSKGRELVSLIILYPAPHREKAVFKRPAVWP